MTKGDDGEIITLPTFQQMKNPDAHTPPEVKERLKKVGLWELDPANLFRITWKNQPKDFGGLFGKVNAFEFPNEITGVDARIIALCGKWFPTGAHKVGAAFACLAPRLASGAFDPKRHKAVWPSTGNFCRGGAYISRLLGCGSVAILPEGMSKERFDWLCSIGSEVIATPGTESNVKEIYDKVAEIRATRPEAVIFNQFEEMGNHLWHYAVTGSAMEEAARDAMGSHDRLAGMVVASGSAGTTGAGDYIKEAFPNSKLGVAEALQCPTLLMNGFGSHRIEGIGDKHVPWIHNVKNTDMALAVDDRACMAMIRLCNELEGRRYLRSVGVAGDGPGVGDAVVDDLGERAGRPDDRHRHRGPDRVVAGVGV
ncbi:MAG: pyridoxal-phosphate dependent enzyme, partial [Synergistaceae bacterium]|nr:pyridoxal-phosphate dependent enzyme [Synergistaceae bacterium]